MLHDLNHAMAIAQQVVVMSAGRVAAAGPPADVITTQMVAEVFGVRAYVGEHSGTGVRFVVSLGSEHDSAVSRD